MAEPANNASYIEGSGGNDILTAANVETVIFGYGGNDTLNGGGKRDFLHGGDGADALFGRGGNDYLHGGADADILDGGVGYDSVNYHESDEAVYINLSTGEARGGHANGDVLIDIEFVRGSQHDDTLIGDDGDNFLCGLGGNDTLLGLGGDDVLRGAEHEDVIDGGDGFDTATFWSSTSAVTVDLSSGTGSGGHAEGDVLISIERVQGSADYGDTLIANDLGVMFHGYGGDDTLTGGEGADSLFGGDDNDVITGAGGNDMLFGENGDDSIDGGAGADLITAGLGNDVIAGGAGADQFKFRQGDGVDIITDYEAGLDRIIFSDHQTTWRDITTVETGDDVVIHYGDDEITVLNATAGDVWEMFKFF